MIDLIKLEFLYRKYRNELRNDGKSYRFSRLKTFISFCAKRRCNYLSKDLIDEWCIKHPTESINSANHRIAELRNFIAYSNKQRYTNIPLPLLLPEVRKQRKGIPMTEMPIQNSVVSEMLEKYILYLKTLAPRICDTTHKNLIRFNNFCARVHPEAKELTEDIVNSWCDRRPFEKCKSRNTRVLPVSQFLRYAIRHHWTKVSVPPSLPRGGNKPRIPHIFTEDELANFFNATILLRKPVNISDFDFKLRSMQIPVFFRLLLSTGMRTNEARLLDCEDVDLKNGIINIRHTKGWAQHRVALHLSIWELLKRYDHAVEKLLPKRKVFFPTSDGKYHDIKWQGYAFSEIWRRISKTDARPYDFRSNYAVKNINSWNYDGTEWFDKLLVLGRSMGHKTLQSTCYYYQLAPMFPDMLETLSGSYLHDILPNLEDFYNDET